LLAGAFVRRGGLSIGDLGGTISSIFVLAEALSTSIAPAPATAG
jgi:hypothetical protein